MTVIDRRDLLKGSLGAAAGLLPLLGRSGKANAATFPTRLVVWFTPQEPIDKAHWNPGPNFQLTPVMQPLEPHKSKILMVGDLASRAFKDLQGSGHYMNGPVMTNRLNVMADGKTLTSDHVFYGGGISIDQYIAQKLNTKALVVGVSDAAYANPFGIYRISFTGAAQPVAAEADPRKAFNGLFAGFTQPPAVLSDLYDKKKSVLDVVSKHITSLRPRLAAQDWLKMDRHLAQVRALEAKVNASAGPAPTCTTRAPAAGLNPRLNADIPNLTRAQIDVAVQALACNLTRVATIQIGSSGSFGTPQWPAEGIDVAKIDHDIAHQYYSGGVAAEREALEKYHYNQFAYLLKQMDAVPEGDGTLLDHSLVFWVKALAYNHSADKDMMFMFAGGANGQLKGGRFVSRPGAATENLLVNICNLMGLPDTVFGDPKYCSGALDLG